MGVSDLSEARRAVFFDRDGTLNRAYLRAGVSHPPVSPDQLEILPRVSEATRRLKDAGFVLVCVSNQPDVARGVLTRGTADGINTAVREMLCLMLWCVASTTTGTAATVANHGPACWSRRPTSWG